MTRKDTDRRASDPSRHPVRVLLALLGAAALAAPGAARAQAAPLHLEFGLQGGRFSPAGTLAEGDGVSGGDLELTESFAFGGHAGLQLPGGLQLEAAVVTAPGTDLEGSGGEESGASYLAATGHVVWLFPIPLVEPFLGAGGGVRRVSFDRPGVLGTGEESALAGSLLGGAYVTAVPGWRIRLELRDVVSGFEDPRTGESELQNDLFFLAGLSWRVP